MKTTSLIFVSIIILIACFCNNINAQKFPSEYWHPGKVVTFKKDTLYGDIMYNFVDNSIQLKQKRKLLVFTAKTLLYFKVNGQYYGKNREFFMIPVDNNDYLHPLLFEVLYKGPLTLLNREYVINTYVSTGPYSPQIEKKILTHHLYILNAEGRIFEINKKKTLLSFFTGLEKEIADYIKRNKLKTDKAKDMQKLLHYYNITFYKREN